MGLVSPVQSKPVEPTMVAISVSSEGIRVIETMTTELLLNTFIKDISYALS